MAMAAYLSGITLAHAGLGAIHGFASVIGGMYNAPHGAICGSLLSQTLATNLKKMLKHASVNRAHNKIVKLYEALFLKPCNISPETAVELIIELINSWATEMKISTLSQLGVKKEDLEKIAEQTQLKNNPVMLEKDELIAILMASL
jgi:alcohol dehydrogenase class IV